MQIIQRIIGEFAFAYYNKGKLFLVRDYIGVKPLYYYQTEKSLYFASEIKALIPAMRENPKPGNIDTTNYIKPFGNYTSIQQIKQVLPEHIIEFDIEKNKITAKQTQYSSLQNEPIIFSQKKAKKTIKEELEKAVSSMMVSDVKMALLLSGGIDSSILASIMSDLSDRTIPAYCVGSSENNEFSEAEAAAGEFGLRLKTIEIGESFIEKNAGNTIRKIETFDSGMLPTAIAMDKLFSKIRQKTVISGEGADELFGGYEEAFSVFRQQKPDYKEFHKQILNAAKCIYQRQLARLDKISLSHSIEARVPFLHKNFAKAAISIDPRLKYTKKREKAVLFSTFKNILPEKIRKKHKERFGIAAGTKIILEKKFGNLQKFAEEKFVEEYCKKIAVGVRV